MIGHNTINIPEIFRYSRFSKRRIISKVVIGREGGGGVSYRAKVIYSFCFLFLLKFTLQEFFMGDIPCTNLYFLSGKRLERPIKEDFFLSYSVCMNLFRAFSLACHPHPNLSITNGPS